MASASVKISVIMSIYNCAQYLPEAIDSIFNQTFTDWELLICDDGSEDETYIVAKDYKERYPEKIRLMRLRRNCRQAVARNKCIERARGNYIAIMDGDDTCDSERLEREYTFLSNHPEIDFVGTGMNIFDEKNIWGNSIPKECPAALDLVKGTPFCAATCMFRKTALDAIGGYREGDKYWRIEDVDLFVRLYANGFKGMNIPEPLYSYREYRDTIRRRTLASRIQRMLYVKECVGLLGLPSWMKVYGVRSLLVGMLPHRVYEILHRWKYGRK